MSRLVFIGVKQTMAEKQLEQNYSELQRLVQSRQQFESGYTDPASPYVKYKTDINYADIHGNTLLHYAAALGNLAKVEEYCAQKDININCNNIKMHSPLMLALQNGYIQVAQYLYDQGARCNRLKLSLLQDQKSHDWLRNAMQDTVTKYTELFKPLKVANILKLKKSSYQENNFFKNFNPASHEPFTRLLNLAIQTNDIDAVKLIVQKWEKWADKNPIFLPNGKRPHTPADISHFFSELLIVSAEMNHQELCSFFISKGAEISPPASQHGGDTSLFAAVRSNKSSMVRYILERGANPNCQSRKKKTPLMLAIKHENVGITKELLNAHADLDAIDIDGNTTLHYAVRCSNPDILKLLIDKKHEHLTNAQNIYGHTPLDIALQYKNDSAILMLAPNSDLTAMQQLAAYGKIPVRIDQNTVLNNLSYFFKLHYRSIDFFTSKEQCNGLKTLFHRYSSRGMANYFYSTLALSASWDGKESTLHQKCDNRLPQAKYHENLAKLFEQWANDIIWFQHGKIHEITNLQQHHTKRQYELISFYPTQKSKYDYVSLHNFNLESDIRLNKQQFTELFTYLMRMPSGVHFSLGGDEHATGNHLQDKSVHLYYDANFKYQTTPVSNAAQLLQRVFDYKYTLFGIDNKFGLDIEMFCFKKDFSQLQLERFKIFQDPELPNSREEAVAFQKKSPNKFTHLHIAIMTHSLPCIKKLLEDGFCDINAVDRYDRSILEISIESNSQAIIELIVQQMHLITQKTLIKTSLLNLYENGDRDLVHTIIKYFDTPHLIPLFFCAIENDDVQLVKTLISTKGISVDRYGNSGANLPLTYAIECYATDVIDFLLDNKASILEGTRFYVSALALSIERYPLYYEKIIERNPLAINEFDKNGETAIHIALKHGALEIFKDLLDRGADICLKSPQHYTASPLQMLYTYSRCPNRRPIPIEQFKLAILDKLNLSKVNDRQILFTMLLNEMQESDETFFKQLLAQCHGHTIMLEGNGLAETYGGLLYRAYLVAQVSKFSLLLQAGCDPNHVTDHKTSLLVLNIQDLKSPDTSSTWRETRYQMIELLLDHYADVTLRDGNFYSTDKGKNAIDLINESQDDRLKQIFANRGLLNAPSPVQ